ncbi:MAG: phage holin family protein, partial [Chloroflexi bacterium]|nr:phage holin family protein [Chloroflexota bacterium]
MQTGKDERSLGELFGDLAGQTGLLVREEVALAKAELTQNATRAGKEIGVLVIGGAVAYAGLLALLAAAILGLATALPAWL